MALLTAPICADMVFSLSICTFCGLYGIILYHSNDSMSRGKEPFFSWVSLQISRRQPEARYQHQRTPDRKSSYQKPANNFSRSLIIGGEAVTEDPFRSPLTNKQRANEQRQPNPRSCFGEIQSHPNSLVLIVAIDPNARVVSIVIDAELQQTLRLHHHLPNRIIPNQPPL